MLLSNTVSSTFLPLSSLVLIIFFVSYDFIVMILVIIFVPWYFCVRLTRPLVEWRVSTRPTLSVETFVEWCVNDFCPSRSQTLWHSYCNIVSKGLLLFFMYFRIKLAVYAKYLTCIVCTLLSTSSWTLASGGGVPWVFSIHGRGAREINWWV